MASYDSEDVSWKKSHTVWTLNPLSLLYVTLFQGEDVPKK